jgi:hypothetical protein
MTDLYTATARLIVKLRLGEITEAIEKVALREDERARSRHIRTIVRAQLMRLCGVVCYVRGLSLFLHNKHQQWTDVLTHSQRHPSAPISSPAPEPEPEPDVRCCARTPGQTTKNTICLACNPDPHILPRLRHRALQHRRLQRRRPLPFSMLQGAHPAGALSVFHHRRFDEGDGDEATRTRRSQHSVSARHLSSWIHVLHLSCHTSSPAYSSRLCI